MSTKERKANVPSKTPHSFTFLLQMVMVFLGVAPGTLFFFETRKETELARLETVFMEDKGLRAKKKRLAEMTPPSGKIRKGRGLFSDCVIS